MFKETEIVFRKLLLRILLILSKRKPRQEVKNKKKPEILVIRLNKIGDALVLTPFLSLLKEKTNADITVLADRKNHFVFRNNPNVKDVVVFQKGLANFKTIIKQLNARQYDILIDAHDDTSTTVSFLISFLNAPNKIALRKETEKLFTNTVEKPDPAQTHVVERNLKLLEYFGSYNKNNAFIQYYPSQESLSKADGFIKFNFGESNRPLIGINISAGSEARFWGTERYSRLLNFLLSKNINVFLLSDPSDKKTAEEIASDRCPIFKSDSFDEFAAAVSVLDMLFTPDTSAVHIAAAYKVPVFGLYVKYNTVNMIWYPWNSEYDAVVTTDPDFTALEYDTVIEKFKPFLEKYINVERNTKV